MTQPDSFSQPARSINKFVSNLPGRKKQKRNKTRKTKRTAEAADTAAGARSKQKKFASVDHLSPEAVAAFVDEELTKGAMHRARVHMVHCEDCRAEVAQQRRASERLKEANTDEIPMIPSTLMDRLHSIAHTCPEGPRAEDSAFCEPEGIIDRMDMLLRSIKRVHDKNSGA